MLIFAGSAFPCMIGRSGAIPAADKREGDGATPLGTWPIRGVLLRADRMSDMPPPMLPWRWLRRDDGWSDDPADPAYNRPVQRPRTFSHEQLWRDDHAYDAIVILGHNDAPPVSGLGSAIFFHIFNRDEGGAPRPTEGCVAMSAEDMRAVLPKLTLATAMEIV